MIDKYTDSRRLLAKINCVLLTKTLIENLASIEFWLSKTGKELDKKIFFLEKAIGITMDASISKTKLYTRPILGFDKNYKNT